MKITLHKLLVQSTNGSKLTPIEKLLALFQSIETRRMDLVMITKLMDYRFIANSSYINQ